MEVGRRDLLKLLAVGATAGLTPRQVEADPSAPDRLLEFPPLGNLTLLHLTDSHATLRAENQLGVEIITAHWEFMYGIERVRELFGDRERAGRFHGEFLAQNVTEAGWDEPVFRPSTIREAGGVRVGVIGQAFPYTPIAHPRRFVPDLSFGIHDERIQ